MSFPVQRSSGRYRYLHNGENTGIEEKWLITDRDQQRDISCQRVAPAVGITISVDTRQHGKQFEHCTIHWEQHSDKNSLQQALRLTADYAFSGNLLRVTRTSARNGDEPNRDGRVSSHESACESAYELKMDGIFSPLMRIFNGAVIQQLLEAGGSGRVVVPWIRDQQQHDRLLLPDGSQRQAEFVAEETLGISDVAHPCKKYHYSGGEYASGTPFWLDPHGVMLKYQWQQDSSNLWEVKLQDYLVQRPI